MKMSKAAEVVKFYVLCNKLKNVVRTGWKIWNVKKERLESVAEHIYGVQMLAIAMWSEYDYKIDIEKVIMMLAVHELEEIRIGDYAPFEISHEEKEKIGHKAVDEVLAGVMKQDEIKSLILEFDARKTEEAKFALYCDKLEADLQVNMYEKDGCVDALDQANNPLMKQERTRRNLEKAGMSVGKMWLRYNREAYGYDKNFTEVSEYAEKNGLEA